jgi:hypothetical protein
VIATYPRPLDLADIRDVLHRIAIQHNQICAFAGFDASDVRLVQEARAFRRRDLDRLLRPAVTAFAT